MARRPGRTPQAPKRPHLGIKRTQRKRKQRALASLRRKKQTQA